MTTTANYSDLSYLLNDYNLSNDESNPKTPAGAAAVSGDESGYYNLTYTIFTTLQEIEDAVYYNSYTGSDNILGAVATTTRIDAIDVAFKKIMDGQWGDYSVLFQDVANITFTEAAEFTEPGAITLGQLTSSFSRFAEIPARSASTVTDFVSYGADTYGDIWINTENDRIPSAGTYNVWEDGGDIVPGTDAFKILIEEISHSLGVDIYTGTIPKSSQLDSQKYTITSYKYLEGMEITDPSELAYVTPSGLQMYDIAALQSIYGRNYSTRSEDTLYTKGKGFGDSNFTEPFIYTIWDGAGVDLIDASLYSDRVKIDLRQGEFSSIGPSLDPNFDGGTGLGLGRAVDNVGIAYYAVVENAIGASNINQLENLLIGNAWNNVLLGGIGTDFIYGDGTTYDGSPGFHESDQNRPGSGSAADESGDDVLLGGMGTDILFGGKGNDILHGGYKQADIDAQFQNGSADWDSAGQFTGTNNANEQEISDLAYEDDGGDSANYSRLAGVSIVLEKISDTHFLVTKTDTQAQQQWTDHLYSIEYVVGTNGSDVFGASNGETLFLEGRAGGDTYIFDTATDRGIITITEAYYDDGVDAIRVDNISGISVSITINVNFTIWTFANASTGASLFSVRFVNTQTGIENVEVGGALIRKADFESAYADLHTDPQHVGPVTISDVVNHAYYGGISGSGGGGGGVGAETDGSGNVTGMQVAPSIGHYVNYAYADEVVHPWVVTSYAASGYGDSQIHYESYIKDIDMVSGIRPEDVRLTAVYSGVLGAFELQVHIDSLNEVWNIPYAEAGRTINGIAVTNSSLFNWMSNSATSVSGTAGSYQGSYDDEYSFSTSNVTVHYDFETITFADSTVWDMTAGLTFTGTSANETLYGFDTRGDTLIGLGGSDNLRGYGGDDILIGGAGADYLYGGLGDDAYLFEPGFGVDIYNVDHVSESVNEGTDTIYLGGTLTAENVYTWTDYSGWLYIQSVDNPDDILTIDAVRDSSGTDVGSRVEYIAFSDSTVWDLTQGLILNDNDQNHQIRGSANSDTISGGGGNDAIYAYGGNDILIGGTGADYLYGGTGNDTYAFEPGFGVDQYNLDQVYEAPDEGSDTIHLGGSFTPDNIYTWTDSYGWLYIQSASDPDDIISVEGYANASGTDIGQRIEYITFSDSTVWDLTEGLILNDNNANHSMRGSAGADIVNGGGGNDTVYTYGGDDILIGGAGADYLSGGSGADTFVFEAATAFDASDTIADFSALDDDVIDLRDLLDGGYDPLTDALADFVQSTESGGSTLLSVDYDGLGTAYGWTQIAMLSGTTGLGSADDMLTAGQLLVA